MYTQYSITRVLYLEDELLSHGDEANEQIILLHVGGTTGQSVRFNAVAIHEDVAGDA